MSRRGFSSRRPLRIAAVCLALTGLVAGCREDESELTLVWQDDFGGPAGQSPSASRWTFDVGTGWGNAQLEFDTARPENVSLDGNGNLAIVAREEEFMGQSYTSARITTAGLFEQERGRFEARIKLPVGQGIWPAFWLLGDNFDTIGWPACGEIDIMEYRGQDPTILLAAAHGPGYSGGGSVSARYRLPDGRFPDDFHVFAIEWTEGRITWSVDDIRYHAITSSNVPGPWVFDHPFYIILNVAVGGNFVGPPDESTSFPQTMLIDWVRVYGA